MGGFGVRNDSKTCDTCPCSASDTNTDGDPICDCVDNCPSVTNASQSDSDLDGAGNACDNCLVAANAKHGEAVCVAAHPIQERRFADASFAIEHDGRRASRSSAVQQLKEVTLFKFTTDDAAHSRNLATDRRWRTA